MTDGQFEPTKRGSCWSEATVATTLRRRHHYADHTKALMELDALEDAFELRWYMAWLRVAVGRVTDGPVVHLAQLGEEVIDVASHPATRRFVAAVADDLGISPGEVGPDEVAVWREVRAA